MRELVLNDVCLGVTGRTLAAAAVLIEDVERGLAALLGAGHILPIMRLTASTSEVVLSPGMSLYDALQEVFRSSRGGRLFARLASKYPVEDDVEDGELAALVDWSIPAHPGSLALVLCARSGRIAVSISTDPVWQVDPIALMVAIDPAAPHALTTIPVDNVFSEANALSLSDRLKAAVVQTADPATLWRERSALFPHLEFAPRVEGDLANLGAKEYGSAVSRLGELERAVAGWRLGQGSPQYLSRVTGESEATMNQYRSYRIFRSITGSDELFEKHARLAGGFRVHLREIFAQRRVEIGYIGPHLPIVSTN